MVGFRAMAMVLLVGQVNAACMGWHTTGTSPQAALQEKPPKSIRLTMEDGSKVVLLKPAWRLDGVSGEVEPGSPRTTSSPPFPQWQPDSGEIPATMQSGRANRIVIPADQVRQVEVRRVQPATTVFAVLGGVVLFAVVGCAASDCMEYDFSYNP